MLGNVRSGAPADWAQPNEEMRALLRAEILEALAPLSRGLAELERRVDALERRPLAPAALSRPPVAGASLPEMPRTAMASFYPQDAGAQMGRAPLVSHHGLDVKAIERDPTIIVVGGIDGRVRRRKLILAFVAFLLVVFGGLGYLLAESYAPHP